MAIEQAPIRTEQTDKAGFTSRQWRDWFQQLKSAIDLMQEIQITAKIENIPTDFSDGSIPFASGGLLTEENSNLFWDSANNILNITGIIKSTGRIKGTVYVTPAMSPYSIQIEDEIVNCDTDISDITLLLPESSNGEPHKIINVGSSNNIAYITPFGIEELIGINATEPLYDGETLDISYDENTGWWA